MLSAPGKPYRLGGRIMTIPSQPFYREHLCAWAAGFFEGEGCVYLKRTLPDKTHKTERLEARCTITNSERILLEKMQTRWGGTIRSREPHGIGKKTLYQWNLYSSAMERFLEDIRPFMTGEKSPKVDTVFELRARQKLTGRARDNYGRIAKLSQEEARWRSQVKL